MAPNGGELPDENKEIVNHCVQGAGGSSFEDSILFNKKLEKLLEKGIRIGCAGGFQFVPLIHWTDPYSLFNSLDLQKGGDIPHIKLGLIHIMSAFLGITRIGKFNDLTDRSLAILSGLPRVPDQSTCQDYLGLFQRDITNRFLGYMDRRFIRIGEIVGDVVNADRTSMEYTGTKPTTLGFHPQANGGKPIIIAWATQCQKMQNPIWLEVTYADVTPAEMFPGLVTNTQNILSKNSLYVFDRLFHVYNTFHELDTVHNVGFLTIAKDTPRKIIDNIPEEKFQHAKPDLQIATTWFDLWDKVRVPDAPVLKLIGAKDLKANKRIGYITNNYHTSEPDLLRYYKPGRQYIDNMFRDSKGFYGLDDLPSFDLEKIRALVIHKMYAKNVISYFKHMLGGIFYSMYSSKIYEKFIDVPGFVKLDDSGTIVVRLDPFKCQKYVAPLYKNLKEQMISAGLSPEIPYLNNHPIEIKYSNFQS